MSEIIITINSSEVDAMISQLTAKLNNLQPVMNAVGFTLKERIRMTFREVKSPHGVPWKRLSRVTIARRRNGGNVPLTDTGILRNSINYKLSGQSVEIGTNAKQAAMMNFGGTKAEFSHLWGDVPAREFIPMKLPKTWENEVIEMVENYLGII